ncbi:ubiquitin-60S ribosomal protein L40-like [Megalobrama amblycephala]|uniref:ubiquitin-60S ribosomal protein L40-like n=1 Tax=Megalobrama amblycephala TaxID=75352 RepID=UPI002013DAD7|nr:ubiquitin-60S ribosomal protein L40-like [Megalobrama amblycephala]XP_048014989.1 ubiquitin-60S ribosomal protein L40-like [Megalobrama amblycephala]
MNCKIFVKDERGKILSVDVDSVEELKNMTVKELIRRVRPDDEEHDEWRILYGNQILDHDRTLGDYGVSNGCIIHMTKCLRGGGGPPPDEDKGVPRTESMDKLADMRQEESSGSCCII